METLLIYFATGLAYTLSLVVILAAISEIKLSIKWLIDDDPEELAKLEEFRINQAEEFAQLAQEENHTEGTEDQEGGSDYKNLQ